MGTETITTRKFVCNHCRQEQVFSTDCDAGKAGWAILNVNGREFALCRAHYSDLKIFLHAETLGPVRPKL